MLKKLNRASFSIFRSVCETKIMKWNKFNFWLILCLLDFSRPLERYEYENFRDCYRKGIKIMWFKFWAFQAWTLCEKSTTPTLILATVVSKILVSAFTLFRFIGCRSQTGAAIFTDFRRIRTWKPDPCTVAKADQSQEPQRYKAIIN